MKGSTEEQRQKQEPSSLHVGWVVTETLQLWDSQIWEEEEEEEEG